MNKSDLTRDVASVTGLAQSKVKDVLDVAFAKIRGAAKRGERVALADFGIFTVAERAERQGHNPSTKAPMTIPAHRVVKFKASFDV